MNIENIQEKLNKLPKTKDFSFFLKTRKRLTINYSKKLIGHIIYFNWHHDNMIERISGKVLDFENNKLIIYTNYTLMLDEDINDLKNNKLVKSISINNITDICKFKEYTKLAWELIPEDYAIKIFEITNVEDKTLIALTYNCDTNLYMAYKTNSNKIKTIKYPISLIKNMREIKIV